MDGNKLKFMDIFSISTISSPEKATKVAKTIALFIAGLVLLGIVVLLVIRYGGYEASMQASRPGLSLKILDPDRILVLIIAFMMYRVSRVGAVLGAIYYIGSFLAGIAMLALKVPGGSIQISLLIFGFLTLRACQATFNYHTLRQAKTIWRNAIVKTVASIVYGSLLTGLLVYLLRSRIIDMGYISDESLGNMMIGVFLIGVILSFCGLLPFTRKKPLCTLGEMPAIEAEPTE